MNDRITPLTPSRRATARGYKFDTPEEAWENASAFVERCAEILSERIAKEGNQHG